MKKLFLLAALNICFVFANAQTSSTIKITGTKFPFEIMQQWIDAYVKTHTDVQFQLSRSIPAHSSDLLIAAHSFNPGELNDTQEVIAVNRYAQLPIINSNRTDLKVLQQKGFTKEDLKKFYFNKTEKDFTVYKRDKNVCASRSFAGNVTGKQLDVAGNLVNGDDRALSAAVKKDVNGISYKNLSLIYNLQTRKVTDSIAILPIDLNGNGKIDADENIYSTLDDALNFLSTSNNNIISQDDVNIVVNKNNVSKTALDFLNWIIRQGQQYNRAYGFLSLDETVVVRKQKLLNSPANDNALIK